jgi:hypothetical protein
MSNQSLVARKMEQIPAAVAELFGRPPVLPTEDVAVYGKLCLEIAKSVDPSDIIEWMWTKDICDYTWEIRRLRDFKVKAIAGHQFFSAALSTYTEIDHMLASVESRRNALIREVERRREGFASRLRKSSDDVIDGEFTDAQAPSDPIEPIEEMQAEKVAPGAGHIPTRDAA